MSPHFDNADVLAAVGVMALVTCGLRALPFVAAKWLQRHALVRQLGQFLPLAIMVLLLAHSLVGAARTHPHGPWPEALAAALVLAAQWRTRNALLAMLLGTGSYVLMRNVGWWV